MTNQTWVSDFTYVPTDEGWLYLCTFIDLFGSSVVGWAVSKTLDRNLATAEYLLFYSKRKIHQSWVIFRP